MLENKSPTPTPMFLEKIQGEVYILKFPSFGKIATMQFRIRQLCISHNFHIMKQYEGKLNSIDPYLNQTSSYYGLSLCVMQMCLSTYMCQHACLHAETRRMLGTLLSLNLKLGCFSKASWSPGLGDLLIFVPQCWGHRHMWACLDFLMWVIGS